MWPFQQAFRFHVEYDIQKVLTRIGLQTNGKVKVLLIGLATKDNLRHELCIEPEDGPLIAGDLCSIRDRTEKIRQSDPEYHVFDTHPRISKYRKRGLYLRSRAQAIAEAIESSGRFEGLKFFVSSSAPIGDYDIHTCVGIPIDALESVPSFNNPKKDDYHGRHIEESLVQAIINSCLGRADRAIYLPNPGEGLEVLGDQINIIRSSAERFVRGITRVLTPELSDLFRLANDFSSLTYERSGARGHLTVTSPDNLTNKLRVTFQNPIGLSQSRSVRKLLELTDETKGLLSDSRLVYGLGECNAAPDVAKITIEGHARWSIAVDNTTLMKVTYEHASLPKQILDKDLFRGIAERTVGAIAVERIWNIFLCVLEKGQGTTIVVSEDPISETRRLGQESLSIQPEYLDQEDIARLGRVDGAIVLGPDGRCYAFGAILDGLATSSGDKARGARFNSSVRYQQTSGVGTMVIVISDDGTVDLIPNLRPRVSRQVVEEAVKAFYEYSQNGETDGEEWGRRHKRVEGFIFYLDQDQCDRVNEAFEIEMDAREEAGDWRMLRESLRPNPDMNDSYFFDS